MHCNLLAVRLLCSFGIWIVLSAYLPAQQEVGYLEKFATATDRRTVLKELIPGTEDYFYYHCLHYQNQKQLAEAQALLDQWRAKFGENAVVVRMTARQMLLSYDTSHEATLTYLRNRLGVQLEHASPRLDRAAALASRLDPQQLDQQRLIELAIQRDPSLAQVATFALPLLVDRQFSPVQLRSWLQRLDRADFAGLVKRIAEELQLVDSAGFGWAPVHQMLSLAQLDELLKLHPKLLEHEPFIRSYAMRLVPSDGTAMEEPAALRAYTEMLVQFARRLPASQNSFKAQVLGNLLRLNLREGKFDRALFLEYLALPRNAPYYVQAQLRLQAGVLADLNFSLAPQVILPPIGDDTSLIRSYLEHFFQSSDMLDDFAKFLDRDYLNRVLAEAKILYGSEDAATWYAKLSPPEQKNLRERVELRFGPGNATHLSESAPGQLTLQLKNVSQLLVRIYQVNPRNYYRTHQRPLSTDIDLDGLVANAERQFDFAQPADRRHTETIDLPELKGRGVWVIDVLGGGQRSRALIQKGGLSSLKQLGDAGHVLRIIDDQGQWVPTAHVEINGRAFTPDSQGRIVIPYSAKPDSQNILLIDGDFAVMEQLALQSESYRLQAGFVIDRQALVAGSQSTVVVRARLLCNDRPISIGLLEQAQLIISAVDMDDVTTTQTTGDLKLNDSGQLVHKFLVPQRLSRIDFTLSGRVTNQSLDRRDDISASQSIQCNDINKSTVIGSFFLRQTDAGYRLLVLGRNGEPLIKLPVSISASLQAISTNESLALATDAQGEIDLGSLDGVTVLNLSAQGVQNATLQIRHSARQWPAKIHSASKSPIVLPLGTDTADRFSFSLTEVRRGTRYRDVSESLEIGSGSLTIAELSSGNYVLKDHVAGQETQIAVVDLVKLEVKAQEPVGGEASKSNAMRAGYLVGPTRMLESPARQPLVIAEASVVEQQLRIQLRGSDVHTRVHVLATVFVPTLAAGEQATLPFPSVMEQSRRRPLSFYIDSLQLDEEYSYILQRQQATKYPGNLLPQPTMLVQPWEISLSENQSKSAAAGSVMPALADPAAPAAAAPSESLARRSVQAAATTSYDFLAKGAIVLANLVPDDDGSIAIPLEQLNGFSSVEVLAVHPTALDQRRLALPATPILKRDLRLKEAFASETHLVEKQTVRLLNAKEKVNLGDARTSRVQLYTTLGDVYRLYGTLLQNPDWEKFRFLTQWAQLSDEEKRANYSESSCHELDFFLFHKDRAFFDQVVQPLVAQKLDKQIVDLWLLDRSLEAYQPLWRVERLNTLERLLLAQRVEAIGPGAKRWLDEFLSAHPIDPVVRSQRFETALRGTLLDAGAEKNMLMEKLAERESGQAVELRKGGMMGGSKPTELGAISDELAASSRALASDAQPQSDRKKWGAIVELKDKEAADNFAYFEQDRSLGLERARDRFYQSPEATRQWAETHYYKIRLQQQVPGLIPPSLFWQEFASAGIKNFLSQNIDLPVSSINEALCAMAVLDLPWESPSPELAVEDERLVVTTAHAAIAYVQSIEPADVADAAPSILVGEDIYLAEPHTDAESNRPLQSQPLLIGTAYRSLVVVTNPSSSQRRVQVLAQIPAGAVPLATSKVTRSSTAQLSPYSSAQVQTSYYFPEAGEFGHYGSQVSADGKHLIATDNAALRVLAEPETVDQTTWSYVADWGTNDEVLAFLSKANLQKLDVSRIAFRLQDKAFYGKVIELLTASQRFDAAIWAYSIKHDAPVDIAQLLHNRPDIVEMVGPAIASTLITVDPKVEMSYEHLEYKPLVLARMHQLGTKRLVLNDRLFTQYQHLLNVLAHQPKFSDDQRLELCYYLLIQNRIEEALGWFGQISVDNVATRLQYDYFDAYLDFFRGEYDRARSIAQRYASYPVPRWQALFAEIDQQVQQRADLIAGQEMASTTPLDSGLEQDERLLTDRREAQQNRQAAEGPALELNIRDGVAKIEFRNLTEVTVHYYLMDIELLFSRNPFVAQGSDRLPAIRPNHSESLSLKSGAGGTQTLELPTELLNRNLLIEVTGQGISRSSVLTANSLAVTVTEPYGRIQVRSQVDRSPVEAAYVKVYARHRDGQIRFYKDGYTDLRGQFEYASLSTNDLETVERFAILVVDPKRGALVREAAPPTR